MWASNLVDGSVAQPRLYCALRSLSPSIGVFFFYYFLIFFFFFPVPTRFCLCRAAMSSETGDAGPAEVEPMPGYLDLISKASSVMLGAWRDCGACGLELSKRTLLDNAYITLTEIALFFFCAFLWTQVRRGLTERLFEVGGTQSQHNQVPQAPHGWLSCSRSERARRLVSLIRAPALQKCGLWACRPPPPRSCYWRHMPWAGRERLNVSQWVSKALTNIWSGWRMHTDIKHTLICACLGKTFELNMCKK